MTGGAGGRQGNDRPGAAAGAAIAAAPSSQALSHPLVEAARVHRERRSGELTHDVSVFALLLRDVGIPVPVAAVLLATRALTMVALERQADVQAALRCAMTAGTHEGAVFDVVFPVFWSAQAAEVLAVPAEPGGGDEDEPTPGDAQLDRRPGGLAGSEPESAEGSIQRAAYSSTGREDGTVPVLGEHQRELAELARRLARAVGTSPSRRRRVGDRGDMIELRDSLRHNLRFGEEMLVLRRSRRVHERARLVVLCDVSSSMQPYTPLFLSFVHALTKAVRRVESAIFNVETSFVTEVFKRRVLWQALAWLQAQSIALAGGTRIGHCLHAFTSSLERRGALHPATTALILSDGWDVGDGELLQREMQRLRSQVGRVIWLDPHAAATGYRPEVRGLQICGPFLDDYLDFSTLDSLRALVARIQERAGTAAPRRPAGIAYEAAYTRAENESETVRGT